jgi:hypothetical protein
MAEKKISQLTAKSANLDATDLIPIAESDGLGGYVTKHITGAEVVGGAGSTTIYNGDSSLSGNRIVDLNANALVFDNGQGVEITNVKTFGTEVTIPSTLIPNYGVKHDVDTTNWSADNTKRLFQVKDTNLNTIVLAAMNGGRLLINEAYYLPNADGEQGQVLRTDGAGALSFGNLSIGLFSQTADSTPVTNTTTPSSLLGTGVGSLSVPANGFAVGDSFHCNIKGDISNLNNETIVIELKSGSVVLATSGTLTLPTMTSQPFEIEADFTIRAIGAATTAAIMTAVEFNFIQNSGTSFQGKMFHSLNNTTFDTTISNTLDVHVTWGTASASNSIFSHITNLRRTY